jgi:hypothetical protein
MRCTAVSQLVTSRGKFNHPANMWQLASTAASMQAGTAIAAVLALLIAALRARGLCACHMPCCSCSPADLSLLLLLLLLLMQVRERGLDVAGPAGLNTREVPKAAAQRSSESDVERVAAHMLAQEGVSGLACIVLLC